MMARPNLAMNVKFKRALQMLSVPRPHIRGYLEEMWDTAYADGNALLGDPSAVEAACGWEGEEGNVTRFGVHGGC